MGNYASKKKGKRYKIAGTAILLFAFSTQQFLVNKYVGKMEGYFKGYLSYSAAYNSALLYENLFFTQALATDVADGEILKKAAMDNIAGFSVQLISTELPLSSKQEIIQAIFDSANNVSSLETYNEYKTLLNSIESQYKDELEQEYIDISWFKDFSSMIYLILYFIGSSLLIYAMRYE
ncbi:hypothetical protein [Alteromonas flava]|uniref:hypothetical protein n=1 Tax=Alteromonas flava TaxID=2048003 RepID=UPI000C290794|nr:hypothetical protein [Alteromonas flava]